MTTLLSLTTSQHKAYHNCILGSSVMANQRWWRRLGVHVGSKPQDRKTAASGPKYNTFHIHVKRTISLHLPATSSATFPPRDPNVPSNHQFMLFGKPVFLLGPNDSTAPSSYYQHMLQISSSALFFIRTLCATTDGSAVMAHINANKLNQQLFDMVKSLKFVEQEVSQHLRSHGRVVMVALVDESDSFDENWVLKPDVITSTFMCVFNVIVRACAQQFGKQENATTLKLYTEQLPTTTPMQRRLQSLDARERVRITSALLKPT
ncbi:hypothetical protein EV421DRAFT_1896427 [Armillaria borealis]|uniref:Uncharacterized protein n=1 Tax=Armillaria borealis TaxID=47425 RepID=A0AA39K4N0_9AGAR|nr:hypothetical protein EV421DRAFT_1896427 [Armillaria borealis]